MPMSKLTRACHIKDNIGKILCIACSLHEAPNYIFKITERNPRTSVQACSTELEKRNRSVLTHFHRRVER